MAKKETEAEAQATTEENTSDGRYIMIPDPDSGEPIKRIEFIKREVMERGRPRGEVAKQLSQIQGKKVPYQIVFAATKGFKAAKPAPKTEEATEAAE